MKINDILKTKLASATALLVITASALCVEQVFLQAIKESNQAGNAAVVANLMSNPSGLYPWPANIKGKVALTGASVPLIPGAKRLTFDNNYPVRYRVNASASLVANFYRQILSSQGWKTVTKASSVAKLEKLTITYAENPLSKKTNITYAYAPANSAVLGVKIAEADTGTLTPSEPAPAQPLQPIQPAPDSQIQPQEPTQNQMEFSRPPEQPFPGDQGKTQTCRVNGVDMPGSCDQYNNNGGSSNNLTPQNQPWANMCSNNTELACVDGTGKFIASAKVGSDGKPVCPTDSTAKCGNYQQNNQPGQNGQDGRMGQPGQQGPSEEDQKKMDERRFKDMKKGLSQFANGAKMMKRNIARVKTANSKCGVGMPEELENALAQTDILIGKINAAKNADELDEIIGDVQDVGSVMQDWGPRMGDLSRLCQMLKQADRDAKQFDRNVKRIETQAKANKKVDLSELLAEYKTAVSAQKDTLTQAKELAKTDPDSALAKIEDDFYGNMDNLGNIQMQINTIINVSKGLKDAAREIKNYESQIRTLTKKKIDTAELKSLLDNLKAQVKEVKSSVADKADAEELANKIEEVFNTRQEIQDALQEYGMANNLPQVSAGSNYNVKVNLPEAFRKSQDNSDNGEAAAEQGSPSGTKF